jgi:hypothetical protein
MIYDARPPQQGWDVLQFTAFPPLSVLRLPSCTFVPCALRFAQTVTLVCALRMKDLSFFAGAFALLIFHCGYAHTRLPWTHSSRYYWIWTLFFALCPLGSFAAACVWIPTEDQSAYLCLMELPWVNGLIIEVCIFPNGKGIS